MVNKATTGMVRSHLDKCWRFLEPFLPMANCHMVTFITNKLYEKYVPPAIKDELKSMANIDAATDIYWNHLNEKENKSKIDGFDCLRKHLAEMRDHTLDRIDNVWITPDELKAAIGCEPNDLLNVKGFMSEKKNHEVNSAESMKFMCERFLRFGNPQVEVVADAVASICSSIGSSERLYVVDAGGGKGYLSTHLALEHKIKVLGVDWNPNHTVNAINRSEKLEVFITEPKAGRWKSIKLFLCRECGIH